MVVVVEVVVELLFSATQLFFFFFFFEAATPPRVEEESLFPREQQLCFCREAPRSHVVSVCPKCDTVVVRGSERPRSQLSSR